MWEIQQLGERAGALDIDLMLEKRWKMFEGRAVQVALISLLSTDETRGANSICASALDLL